MKTLTTGITITNAIPAIRKFAVLSVHDENKAPTKIFNIEIGLYNLGGKPYGGSRWVRALDTGDSTCLRRKSVPEGADDEVETHQAVVAGAYTLLSETFWLRTGTYDQRKLGLEDVLVNKLLSADFA